MNAAQYQAQTHDFAKYFREDAEDYLALAMLGEAGEACNYYKKLMRIRQTELTDKDRSELQKEIGDILWYIAEYCTLHGLRMEAWTPGEPNATHPLPTVRVLRKVMHWCDRFTTAVGDQARELSLEILLDWLQTAAIRFGYANLEEAFDANIAKLARRCAENDITGMTHRE